MPEDWFAQNAPKAQPSQASGGDDWFTQHAPSADGPPSPHESTLKERFMKATEPTLPNPNTTPKDSSFKANIDAAWNAGANALNVGGNVLKRAARMGEGAFELPGHIESITSRLFSSDEKASSEAEGELLAMHPGAQIADRLKEAVHDWRKSKSLAAENVVGDLLGMYLTGKAGEVAGKAGKSVAKLPVKAGEAMVRNATETTPRDVANVVKETSAKNEVEVEKAAKKTEDARARVADKNEAAREAAKAKNAAQAEKRQVVLQKHFDALQKAKGETGTSLESGRPRTPEELQSHKEALSRGVEQLDTPFKEDLIALKEKVNAEAHQRYGELETALNGEEATPHFLGDAIEEASEKIRGSNTDPTILKDMEKRMNGTDALTYEDLQGYYSELGRELSKGTLAGDVYYAYNTLQDLVGDEMQRIAETKGMGKQLGAARNFYRQMKQTFYDPRSPITKAIRATERGKSIAAFQGADQAGVAALAKYDPELAQRANTLRGYQAEAKGIPNPKPGTANRQPTLSPPPSPVEPKIMPEEPPVVPDTKTNTPESLSAVKAENVTKAAESMRHSKSPLVSAVAGYGTIKALLAKNLATAGMDILARVIYGAAKPMLADIIENPRVIAKLSKFTEKDAAAIAKLPAKQRAAFADTMGQVVDAAVGKGVKVSPILTAAITAAAHQNDSDRITEPPEP